ncbi:MAG TPA: GNAT family N-acetyltransferase [Beijerinckiaceae bacterium]|jgi:GNAT superfamily N-acetyltransferase
MGAIDAALAEEPLTAADAEEALPLSAEAGWNQTAEDWRFMLGQGRGVGVRGPSGRWIGSAISLPLGERLSWIGMVLVAKDARRRGIGTRLLTRAVAIMRDAGGIPGLDATELGRPVYLPLGFRDLYAVSRLRLEAPAPSVPPPPGCTVRPLTPADLPALAAFDAPRSAMERAHVLAYLLGQAPHQAFVAESKEQIAGYVLGRPGRIALQVGPVVADRQDVALALMSLTLSRLAGPALLDVPDAHANLRTWLDRAGAVRQRGFVRMTLGEPPPGLADPSRIFALAGPELG